MEIHETAADLRAHLSAARDGGQLVGLVPTMGNLHEGHLVLVRAAREQCDHVVATIFVNPLQFGPTEDYERYPRSFEQDKEKLAAAGCDTLFVPSVQEVYPDGLDSHTLVEVPELSELYCGASRPGHFNGVATIVCKLFNLVAPDLAFFGLKDYQQFLIIRKMVTDLCLPIRVTGVPTQREEDGLAMSSRNNYLSEEERRKAPALYAALRTTADALESGQRTFSTLEQDAREQLEAAGLSVDYVNICHAGTLLPATAYDHHLVILAAAWLGETRLIDNILVELGPDENKEPGIGA